MGSNGDSASTLILLVEPDRSERQRLTQLVEALGMRANALSDCREAIDCLNGSSYTLVLTHVKPSELESLACVKSMKMNAVRVGRHTPVIALVDALNTDDRVNLRAAGISDFVTRPVTAEKLAQMLWRWIPAVA